VQANIIAITVHVKNRFTHDLSESSNVFKSSEPHRTESLWGSIRRADRMLRRLLYCSECQMNH